MSRRIARALLAVVLGLVLLEGGLRAAGWIYLARAGRGAEGSGAGPTVVCLGDSNVFGLFCAEGESYPARLQQLAGERANVVNAGRPGLDTYGALARLDRALALEPRVLLLTIGANNDWSWAGEGAAGEAPWYESLRVVKLVRLLAGRAEREEGLRRREGDRLEGDARAASIRRDVAALAERARAAGVELVLVAYAAGESKYAAASDALRAVAAERGIPLIDPAPACAELAARRGFGEVFFPDLHPRPIGYEVVARTVYNALIERGTLAGEPVEDVLAGLSEAAPSPLALALEGRLGEDLALALEGGPPGAPFAVFLWGAHRAPEAPAAVDFANDPFARFVRDAGGLRGAFDAEGRARVPLEPLLARYPRPDELRGLMLWCTCFPGGEGAEGGGAPPPAPVELTLR